MIVIDLAFAKHNAQYQPIDIKQYNHVYDRYLCIGTSFYRIVTS